MSQWVAGAQVYQKRLTPPVGLTIPGGTGFEVYEQAMRWAFQKLLPRGWLSLLFPLPLCPLSVIEPWMSPGWRQEQPQGPGVAVQGS